jgi:di/tripeptidase
VSDSIEEVYKKDAGESIWRSSQMNRKWHLTAYDEDYADALNDGLSPAQARQSAREIGLERVRRDAAEIENDAESERIANEEYAVFLERKKLHEATEKLKSEGTVENSFSEYIIRDHDRKEFENKKVLMKDIADFLNHKYPEGTVKLEMQDQYFNMREKIEPVYHILDIARRAMEELGIKPKIVPVRGGTDGSRLSFMGLPCPNIFAGGHNFHGKFEYVPLESMEAAVNVIIRITGMYAAKPH